MGSLFPGYAHCQKVITMSNQLILIAVISFGLGGITGGIVVHVHDGPKQLNAYEQMMLDEHAKAEQQAKDLHKALSESHAFPGGMGKSLMNYAGPETNSGAKKKSK